MIVIWNDRGTSHSLTQSIPVIYCVVMVDISLIAITASLGNAFYCVVMQAIWYSKFLDATKSGGQSALAFPVPHSGEFVPRPPVIYADADDMTGAR